jgi:hypothetical protein
MPWAWGPRICPGKKFSHVEFVAVVSCLLGDYRGIPVLDNGGTEEHGLQRLLAVVEDSDMEIGIKMNHPEDQRVKWVKKA